MYCKYYNPKRHHRLCKGKGNHEVPSVGMRGIDDYFYVLFMLFNLYTHSSQSIEDFYHVPAVELGFRDLSGRCVADGLLFERRNVNGTGGEVILLCA